MTLSSRLMVGYNPLRNHKNFFRLTFTCHPPLVEGQVLEMLASIEEFGEMVQLEVAGDSLSLFCFIKPASF